MVARRLTALLAQAVFTAELAAAPTVWRDSLAAVLAGSDFAADALERNTGLLGELARGRPLDVPATAEYLRAAAPPLTLDDAAFMTGLRSFRRREMLRIAWRDLAGLADLPTTLRELSDLADVAIEWAYRFAYAQQAARFGEPGGEARELIVIGMGKLGGRELNFSSDIDLIFVFPEHGTTTGERPASHEEFFLRLGQSLIRLLGARTADGIVFRVDMRLRPFGESGPLVASAAALEDYLQRQGRDWERYAFVKARAITGASAYEAMHANTIRPFVYRRYLDFGVFESLREMKALIEREVARRDRADHIKLGRGGIREIEFVVQALQLVRGGRDPKLQSPSILQVFEVLRDSRLLGDEAIDELRAAYYFLRRYENRLQMLADEQTHQVPRDALALERIAFAMGFADSTGCNAALSMHRERVARHFAAIVRPDAGDADVSGNGRGTQHLAALLPSTVAAQPYQAVPAGYDDSPAVQQLLVDLRDGPLRRRLDAAGRRRLDALLPRLVSDFASRPAGLTGLRRIVRILESIGPRSAYFALLSESPAARTRLVELCGSSDFLADQVAAHPLLLDELLDPRLLGDVPERNALENDIDQRLAAVSGDEPERQVEVLVQWQRAAVFRVAVADLSSGLPLMQVSDRLTEIAEIIVERAMRLGWQQMTYQFGVPMCGPDAQRRVINVAAVGYGKLGGRELGYSSDLDLVFVHDSDGVRAETDAARTLDAQLFFVRLAQRIVHILTVHSAAGRLYEVDVRLRPSGKGGMLISQLAAFATYQQQEAWTWEHQALLHARAVAGEVGLCAKFEALRIELLQQYVHRDTLLSDVRDMRARMRRELSRAKRDEFDIKQDAGGVADIEFLAQYWALSFAAAHGAVAMYSDTIRQLETLASGDFVAQSTVDLLTAAYRTYRQCTHHRSLQGASAVVGDGEFRAERAAVTAIWNVAFGV